MWENVPSLLEKQCYLYVLCRMTLGYYIKVVIWNVRSRTQLNCPECSPNVICLMFRREHHANCL